jgi:hypothetical protein
MLSLRKSVANYRTTAAGLALGALLWWQGTGFTIPATRQEWTATLGAAAIAVLGVLAKDGATGSQPGQEGESCPKGSSSAIGAARSVHTACTR